jgi:hypothetical protein
MHRARTDHVTPEEFHRYMKPWAVNPRPHRGDYAWMGVPAGQPEPAPVRWVVLGLSWLAVGGLAALAVVALLR